MRIRKISLNNIRSYEKQEINFPNGSVLLSGDIGSGKSTILLALEFALFGLQTGYLSGASLLRGNAEQGSVDIELEIEGKPIKIKRTLKRNKKSVTQDRGFFTLESNQEELGAEELKQRVLDLFGYPLSLIKARTNLLYRFTVYTPQEEMKQILQENADDRIDVLRKIFGIDKYKKIAENAELIAARLREESRFKESQILDLPSLLRQKQEKEQELSGENSKLQKIFPRYNQITEDMKKAEGESDKISLQIIRVNELKPQFAALVSELRSKEKEMQGIKEQIADNEKQIKELESKLGIKVLVPENFAEKIKKKMQEQKDLLEHSKSAEARIIALESKKQDILATKSKIESLDECPTCQQPVPLEHKHRISEENNKKLYEIESNFLTLEKNCKEFSANLEIIEKDVEMLRQEEKNYEKNKIIIESLNERKNYLEKLKRKTENVITETVEIKNQKEKIEHELSALKNIDAIALGIKQKLESLRKKEREAEIEKVKHERNIENTSKILKILQGDIEKKENIARDIDKLKKLNEWLLKHFMIIILTIEKTVMAKLNHEFNLLFEKWFSILVESLNARIDENFTPVIEQQGYEINYEALSGGERTAAALAYRLALNQIINHFMGKLKTKGLLILDEPTDGFSSEQLDKMKDILNELEFEQLILVSHESEVEDFVENVINFEKKEGITKILG